MKEDATAFAWKENRCNGTYTDGGVQFVDSAERRLRIHVHVLAFITTVWQRPKLSKIQSATRPQQSHGKWAVGSETSGFFFLNYYFIRFSPLPVFVLFTTDLRYDFQSILYRLILISPAVVKSYCSYCLLWNCETCTVTLIVHEYTTTKIKKYIKIK